MQLLGQAIDLTLDTRALGCIGRQQIQNDLPALDRDFELAGGRGLTGTRN